MRSRVEEGVVAGRSPTFIGATGLPNAEGSITGDTKVPLAPRLFHIKERHPLCQGDRGRHGTGLSVSRLEAPRDRPPEAEGWASRRGFVPGPWGRHGPLDRTKEGNPWRLRSRRSRPCWALPPRGLSGGIRLQALMMPGQARERPGRRAGPEAVLLGVFRPILKSVLPNPGRFRHNACENYPVLGSLADRPAPRGPRPFLPGGMSRPPGKHTETTRPHRGPGAGERSRRRVGGQVAADRPPPTFRAVGVPRRG